MAPARPDRLPKSKPRIEHRVRHAMRHQKKTIKLGRTAEHRKALLANQVCSLLNINVSKPRWPKPGLFDRLPSEWLRSGKMDRFTHVAPLLLRYGKGMR